MSNYQEMDQAMTLLKEAEGLIRTLTSERNGLRNEKSQLMTKLAESINNVKYAEIVEEMIDSGIVDAASKQEKLMELRSSGLAPEVYKEAMNLAPTLYTLGHLDSSSEDISSQGNPLERALFNYVQNKH
jgi:predicted transcriptional regulator|tara:strand:- start:52 stop:438 length:387 start_codon:yes stop_codon:yes gene_type:complete